MGDLFSRTAQKCSSGIQLLTNQERSELFGGRLPFDTHLLLVLQQEDSPGHHGYQNGNHEKANQAAANAAGKGGLRHGHEGGFLSSATSAPSLKTTSNKKTTLFGIC
ncbi:MAG: hypothetical protein MK213_07050 [Planctomycetes bacterium]|nr:hypothetical protein [Planctomycetota bacterium]